MIIWGGLEVGGWEVGVVMCEERERLKQGEMIVRASRWAWTEWGRMLDGWESLVSAQSQAAVQRAAQRVEQKSL